MAKLNTKKTNADKSDRLALRISAKDKFALELLANKKGISLSALFTEIAKPALKEGLTIKKVIGRKSGELYIPDEVYDPLIPDRLVKLAMLRTDLLSEQEKIIWKVIREHPGYWVEEMPNFKKIRDNWSEIENQANALIEDFSN
jgi:hypothetical protein